MHFWLGGNMKALSKVQLLVETNGWSLSRAQGFVDGEVSRRRGAMPSTYARVGIDDYSLGFRAGYYERGEPRGSGKNVIAVHAASNAPRDVPVDAAAWKEAFEDAQLDGAA
jgi:hypothetical protein